ncbi:hypothetical protein C8R48DRAFT_53328 [Suillus tomentosus]|nr:hypothetical protein C8R48DRAFT_53328 [Suillus tomentosus]
MHAFFLFISALCKGVRSNRLLRSRLQLVVGYKLLKVRGLCSVFQLGILRHPNHDSYLIFNFHFYYEIGYCLQNGQTVQHKQFSPNAYRIFQWNSSGD